MPSRRSQIAMTEPEVQAYLASQARIILVTNGPDGFPHPMPMNFGIDAAGRIVMLTFAKSQKVKNLERDPRATLLVESGSTYEDLKSVILYVHTEIIPPGIEFDACRAAFMAKTQTEGARGSNLSAQADATMAKRVALRFTPDRVVSWDHGKLAGAY